MKVTTEASLFGAWVPIHSQDKKILDVGTGTGLLALMMAQRSNARIEAVEIEDAAYQQAKENIASSPFQHQIDLTHADIFDFDQGEQYDLVISNPPFNQGQWRSADPMRSLAHHQLSFTQEKLALKLSKLVSEEGRIAILNPPVPMVQMIKSMRNLGFRPAQLADVYSLQRKPLFRKMAVFTRRPKNTLESHIVIKDEAGHYTSGFVNLLKPFYLRF
jgi:tRNA1Val (adenine37-N6)-methyltransferase